MTQDHDRAEIEALREKALLRAEIVDENVRLKRIVDDQAEQIQRLRLTIRMHMRRMDLQAAQNLVTTGGI